jgi:uncharacterized protein (DUF924 family)
MSTFTADAESVLSFWFSELKPEDWFRVNPETDERIRSRFAELHAAACRAELYEWRTGARGRLAEVIVLDQFSRNLYRGKAQAFAADPLALCLAQEAVRLGLDIELPVPQRNFLYLPYMHSESQLIHAAAEELFQRSAPHTLDYERQHRAIIDRFGRYPHRNVALGRTTTPEEAEFLKQPGSSF